MIVLGDMAGQTDPQAVGRAVAARLRPGAARARSARSRPRCAREVAPDPGGARASGQWIRRALPLTVSEQGPIGAAGLPAVLHRRVRRARAAARRAGDRARGCAAFGRGRLRAVSAIDAAGPRDDRATRSPRSPPARTGS